MKLTSGLRNNINIDLSLRNKIYQIVAAIPKGRVSTYGLIALKAGGGGPRYVGWCLHHNPDHNSIPCHRIVGASGKLANTFAFGGLQGQKKYLEEDGIKVASGRVVDFAKVLWKG